MRDTVDRTAGERGVRGVGWMLRLAAVIAAEKNLPQGRRLRTLVGVGLLGGAAAIVRANA